MKRFLALLLLAGCANASPAYGPGPAHWGQVLNRNAFMVGEVINPTGESVIVDCDDMRLRIPPHTRESLLMPYKANCDLQNEDTYSGE